MLVVLGLAVAAALAVKVPVLFGHPLSPDDEVPAFYFRNASLFVFPLLAVYFMWKRGWNAMSGLWLALPFAAGAVFANILPVRLSRHGPGQRHAVLTALHLPIALWLAVGFAYVRGRWFADGGRMNFVRFSGELFIYYVLIALGGGVVTAFTFMLFSAIGMNPEWFVGPWLIPCGAAGAVIIGSWLVEAKQSVIENMAPVLTRLFTPLFTILLLSFLATMAWTGNPINVKREVLIGFDLLLAVVVGLVLYAASARDPQAPPDFFDGLQLLLVVSALAVDAVALTAIASASPSLASLPTEWRLLARISSCSSTWRGRRGSTRASCVSVARSRSWSDGRSPICPCTPSGRHWLLSCSRLCSVSVEKDRSPERLNDARLREPRVHVDAPVHQKPTSDLSPLYRQSRSGVFGATRANSDDTWRGSTLSSVSRSGSTRPGPRHCARISCRCRSA